CCFIAGTGLPAAMLLESSLRDTGEPPGWRRSAADDCGMTDKPDCSLARTPPPARSTRSSTSSVLLRSPVLGISASGPPVGEMPAEAAPGPAGRRRQGLGPGRVRAGGGQGPQALPDPPATGRPGDGGHGL